MTYHRRTVDAARGKWRGVLMALGIPGEFLINRHGPCPLCGGKDRFRWDDKEGSGSYICGQCGAGDGMNLAIEFTGEDFRKTASRVDLLLANMTVPISKPQTKGQTSHELLGKLDRASQRAKPGDLVDSYLATRCLDEIIYPTALRFAPRLRDGSGGFRRCMIAVVSGPDGEPVSMHRTFLKPDGSGKAEMAVPRRLLPGKLPGGACVRLGDYVSGGPLGIAEGIETALSASALYDMPVWAGLTAPMPVKWLPPSNCDEVAIFGDNDVSFTGQKAAFELARRLKSIKGREITATVHIPTTTGQDWNDVHRMHSSQESLKSKTTSSK